MKRESITILSQANNFLIVEYVELLASRLTSLGVDVCIILADPTPAGKPIAKTAVFRDMVKLIGIKFGIVALANYAKNIINRTNAHLSSKYKVETLKSTDKLDVNFLDKISAPSSALLILAGTRIIKRDVLDYFNGNVINVHSSMLPYSRGVMPAYWTLNKRKGMGVTLFRLDEGIDTGEILQQISLSDYSGSYYNFLKLTKSVGVELLIYWIIDNVLSKSRYPRLDSSYNSYPARIETAKRS